MCAYARKASRAIWRVSMDHCWPDGFMFPAWTAGAAGGLHPSSLVTLRSVDRGDSAGAALPDLAPLCVKGP